MSDERKSILSPGNMVERIHQAIGFASRCWTEDSTGEFKTSDALQVATELCEDFHAMTAQLAAMAKERDDLKLQRESDIIDGMGWKPVVDDLDGQLAVAKAELEGDEHSIGLRATNAKRTLELEAALGLVLMPDIGACPHTVLDWTCVECLKTKLNAANKRIRELEDNGADLDERRGDAEAALDAARAHIETARVIALRSGYCYFCQAREAAHHAEFCLATPPTPEPDMVCRKALGPCVCNRCKPAPAPVSEDKP